MQTTTQQQTPLTIAKGETLFDIYATPEYLAIIHIASYSEILSLYAGIHPETTPNL